VFCEPAGYPDVFCEPAGSGRIGTARGIDTHQEGGQVDMRYFRFKGHMCPFSARPHVNRWVEKMAKEQVIETSEDAGGSHARMELNLTV